MSPTDALTAAISGWVTEAAAKLDADNMGVLTGILGGFGALDIRVVVSLRAGTVVLEAANEAASRRLELYREDVEPFRLAAGEARPAR